MSVLILHAVWCKKLIFGGQIGNLILDLCIFCTFPHTPNRAEAA